MLAGGQLFGFFGILLALPVAAVLAVLLRYIHDTYKQSHIYGIDAPNSLEVVDLDAVDNALKGQE